MDIDSPRFPGSYRGRDEDCEDALAAAFDEFVAESGTQYLDLKKVIAALTPGAVAAGWSCAEILEALHAIVQDYQKDKAGITTRIAPMPTSVARH